MPSSDASSDASSTDDLESYEEYRLAQLEWEESVNQLQQLLTIVFLPFVGKWLGRRWSHMAYARYLRLGLSKAFFVGKLSATVS